MNQPTFDGLQLFRNRKTYNSPQSQGQQANKTGQSAEDTIYCILVRRGLQVETQKDIAVSIYGTGIKTDIYIAPCDLFPYGLAIESKWQGSSGSVDEKFPYLVENIRTRFPCPCIVILDGGGYREGAAEWLRCQVDGQHLVGVFTFAEFLSWCNHNL